MKIGFDAKRAVNNNTGLGNYSRLVIDSLAERCPGSRFLLYTPRFRQNPRLQPILDRHPNLSVALPENSTRLPALWRTWGMTRQLMHDGVQLYHGLSNELPLTISRSPIPSVVTIHDVIYRRLPGCYNAPDRLLYDFKYGHSARAATRIIAVSECTRRDIIEYYGVQPDKIDVVYQGCDDSFRKVPAQDKLEEVRARYSLPERYVIQVGTVERRKNLELTVRALQSLPQDVSLIVVGRDGKGYLETMRALASTLGLGARVRFMTEVPFADLPALYRLASVSAYPSFYEGFGIPVIEAIESGCPVVAATGSCLEEAGGDAAIYVSPRSPREMSLALGQLLEDKDQRARRIAAGKSYVTRFNQDLMADSILTTYSRALETFRAH